MRSFSPINHDEISKFYNDISVQTENVSQSDSYKIVNNFIHINCPIKEYLLNDKIGQDYPISETCIRTDISKSGHYVKIIIHKAIDDWFYVSIRLFKTTDLNIFKSKLRNEQFYKCDQVDGLIDAINFTFDHWSMKFGYEQ